MAIADTLNVKINGSEVPFGFIGRHFRVQAAHQLRNIRHKAFQQATEKLPSDPVSLAAQVSSAIDSYMGGVIVTDSEVNEWLGTPEGYYFAFTISVRKSNPEMKDDRIEQLHDRLDADGAGELRDYWGRSFEGNRYDDILEEARRRALMIYGVTQEQLDEFEEWRLSKDEPVIEEPEVAAPEPEVKATPVLVTGDESPE